MLRHDAPLKSLLNIIPALRIFFFFLQDDYIASTQFQRKKQNQLFFYFLLSKRKKKEANESTVDQLISHSILSHSILSPPPPSDGEIQRESSIHVVTRGCIPRQFSTDRFLLAFFLRRQCEKRVNQERTHGTKGKSFWFASVFTVKDRFAFQRFFFFFLFFFTFFSPHDKRGFLYNQAYRNSFSRIVDSKWRFSSKVQARKFSIFFSIFPVLE